MRQPPGETTQITARTALVLAPHFDDEVLGCGGLLARLTAAGTAVHILFLTDGGGDLAGEERAAYGARRREEAERVAALYGFASTEHLDLPDGALATVGSALTAGIEAALRHRGPDLLLVPSPLEVSPDHRAAFAALHAVLGAVRPGHPLATVAGIETLRILAYEINHPLYPDLLVEVGELLPRLEEAMALYSSQQQLHDYLQAALALRRYRTLTLPPAAAAAEGYVDLRLEDFTTRSPAQLVRHLGGSAAPGSPQITAEAAPRISVVVRTRDRPQLLAEALGSLAANRYRQGEVVLVNDGGAPVTVPEDFPFPVVPVNLAENRGRAAAAEAGVAAATGDWVCFLDDDDLAAPEHLETLAGLASAAGVRVAYTDAAVGIYELDGAAGWVCRERRLPYSRDFDPDLLLLDNYIPFNTLILERALLREVAADGALFDPDLPFFEDWEMLLRLARRTPFHHLARVTCEYRHFRGGGHHIFGEQPRQRGDFLEVKARVLAKHGDALDPQTLARAIDTLRTEAVADREQAANRGRALEETRRDMEAERQERHRLNGELQSVQGELAALRHRLEESSAELARLYREEQTLREALGEQEAHLGRTYGEIERLGAVIEARDEEIVQLTESVREHGEHLGRTYGEIDRLNTLLRTMEGTRAWRLHRWLQRRLGR